MTGTRKATTRTATTRKTAPKATDTAAEDRAADTVTVKVRAPHLVYWDGEQRGGTLHGVDRQTAEQWKRDGWIDEIT
jgi:hypothetical protein